MTKKKDARLRKKSKLADVWHQLKKNRLAVVAMFVLLILIIIAFIGPLIAP